MPHRRLHCNGSGRVTVSPAPGAPRSPVHLALRLDGTLLTAEVSDADPAAPAVPGGPPRILDWAEAGRGLLLVAALATDYGARPRPPGKTVWFTRHLTQDATDPGAADHTPTSASPIQAPTLASTSPAP